MYKNRTLLNIILTVWQLPQIVLGLIFLLIFRNKTTYINSHNNVSVWKINSGKFFGNTCFSLGPIIVACDIARENTIKHETGHSLQSIYFGPLYMLVISIPSVGRFWINKLIKKSPKWYNSGYPELWASKLGGIDDINSL